MVTMLEKTVEIGADRRITLDLTALEGIPEGKARVVLLVLDGAREPASAAVPKGNDVHHADALDALTKSSGIEAMLANAEKTWAYNRAHPEEMKAALRKLRGSLSPASFGGMDGVTYQRKSRDEWDD